MSWVMSLCTKLAIEFEVGCRGRPFPRNVMSVWVPIRSVDVSPGSCNSLRRMMANECYAIKSVAMEVEMAIRSRPSRRAGILACSPSSRVEMSAG